MVVLTIDPARRLAQSMGIDSLDNIPRRVKGIEGEGELHAMMLDMKRTFDEIVEAHADGERSRAILENPSTSPCRPVSRARRSTWRWRNWGSCAPATNGT